MLSDVEISQAHTPQPITAIAERAGFAPETVIPYGTTKAKIRLGEDVGPARGKLVLVTGVSPTPAGEGKTTTLIGLADAMRREGTQAMVAIREPSLGPVFGMKGGAAGGGYAQVVPMEDINLHFTGDLHAITSANNTLAALLDNHIYRGNRLRIDPRRIEWQRCLDVNDRNLRTVATGLGGLTGGVPAETGFTITAASEIMAIFCLAENLEDLHRRLAAITVAYDYDGRPVTAGDLNAAGALTALLRDALDPNLVQTLEGTPALCHGGPFANIAHGCSTLRATRTALAHADVVLTEAGFGSDLGGEKFFDVKARLGELDVAAVVVTATVRSIRYQGESLAEGIGNLARHVENITKFGVRPIVALNVFDGDTEEDLQFVADWAQANTIPLALTHAWERGGEGARELARLVLDNLAKEGSSHPLYDPAEGVETTIETIAREIYHAGEVSYSSRATKDLQIIRDNGWDNLPVVISKTQYSFSADPTQLGAPEGHVLLVRRLIPRTGAGFIVALTGDVMTMPGLPAIPAAEGIDVAADGKIQGLF